MKNILIEKFYNLKRPILITGATGTGKSYLANSIFKKSSINKSNFITVHLASLKEDIIESELFGHKKGSFTGALENNLGYFLTVSDGTLFLDEIGELSMESQKKLLYLLEEGKFTPVGSTQPIVFKGRIIMATNKDLSEMVKNKTFREDLYYRIKTFNIHLENINSNKLIFEKKLMAMFEALKQEHGIYNAILDEELKSYLINKNWPGNWRELKNELEYALLFSSRNVLMISDLKNSESEKKSLEHIELVDEFVKLLPASYDESLEIFERCFLKKRLSENGGKVTLTANELAISKTTLIHKARKYGIDTLKIRAYANEKAA